jgi:hypothetical protein
MEADLKLQFEFDLIVIREEQNLCRSSLISEITTSRQEIVQDARTDKTSCVGIKAANKLLCRLTT